MSNRKVLGTIVAIFLSIVTIIGNINDIVSFFQMLTEVFSAMSLPSRITYTIFISLFFVLIASISLYSIVKHRKQNRSQRKMKEFIKSLQDNHKTDDVKSFIRPFLSDSFEYLLADNSDDIEIYNAERFYSEALEPIEYEVALANKIARADDVDSCKKSFELLHDVTNSWTVFLNKDKKIVSYWIFIALKKEVYDKVKDGKVNEKDISVLDVTFIDLPGRYWGYLLLAGTTDKCKTQENRAQLYYSWLDYIEKLAEKGIFFYEISTMVGSTWGNSSLQTLGMEYQGEYEFGGKMYRYNLDSIDSISYLIKNFPRLVELYKKEFGVRYD